MFVSMCNFFVREDPRKTQPENTTANRPSAELAKMGLSQYLDCYDFEFQKRIKQQLINLGVVQLALFKSCKGDILQYNKEKKLASSSLDSAIPVPNNVKELLDLKPKLDAHPDDLYYCIRHRFVIQEVQN